MNLYRIANKTYADDLDGTGGLYGSGRWHREGTQILYTSEHISLAKLEVLANSRKIPKNQSLVTVEIPDTASITAINDADLPENWPKVPYLDELADITEQWIAERKFWIMRVPSVHSPTEFNYLLNPLHPEHATLKLTSVEPHPFDSRLK